MKKILCIILGVALLFINFLPVASAAVKLSDGTLDGKITAADARIALRIAVGLETATSGSDAFTACDVNQDGKVTASDARIILRAAVGLESISATQQKKDIGGEPPATAIVADGKKDIPFYYYGNLRTVRISLKKIIKGEEANNLAHSENMYNSEDVDNNGKEFRFYIFDVSYISSTGGANDQMQASDLINHNRFYTVSGGSIGASSIATLGNQYSGYGVYDVDIYPGRSSQVVIGIPVISGLGDFVLRVPNENGNTWLLLN